MLRGKKGNFWSMLFALVSIFSIIIIFIAMTPIIDKTLEIGNNLINSSDGRSLLTFSSTIWHKVLIGVLIVSVIIYVIASALRKEPYSQEYYR